MQASYTWSKSIDNTSLVIGGTGSTGAVTSGFSQNPYDTHPRERAVVFRCDARIRFEPGAGSSPGQRWLSEAGEQKNHLWLGNAEHFEHQLRLAVHGVFGDSADRLRVERRGPARPDCEAETLDGAQGSRRLFGEGANNATDFFSIPIHLAGGTGPNEGRFGTLGRNTFRGPAFYNFDFAFIKDTPFGRRKSGAERVDLQFRSEFFNLFNIVTMGLPCQHPQRLGLRRDQQDSGQLAPDSVFTQVDLLGRSAGRGVSRVSAIKGAAIFRPGFVRCAILLDR